MDTYFYGGIGVKLPHSVGLRAFGVVPSWDSLTRKLKTRLPVVSERVLVSNRDNYLECPLSDLTGPSEATTDPEIVLVCDYAKCETFAFLESTWWCQVSGTITIGGPLHTEGGMSVRRLPPDRDVQAMTALGQVGLYGGKTTALEDEEELFATGLRCHERKLDRIGVESKASYPKVMAELLARPHS
jgi:hypothetical protein